MKTVCDYYRNDDRFKDSPYPLTFFSGDAFNPSKESTVTKGSHMPPVLNGIEIDVACPGNHEFDFGAAHFSYLAKDCNFPWLLANMFDPELGTREPLGRCQRTKIIETSTGLKVGVIGLVEQEWTQKLNNSLPADLEYVDMKEVAKELGPRLREDGADIVIILSHARQERDYDFCENLPAGSVDLVLGGHDHWVEHKKWPNGVHFVRSGYDFKNLSYITGFRSDNDKHWDFTVTRRNLNSDVPEDDSMKQLQEKIVADIDKQLVAQVGYAAVPLEARQEKCQLEETNYGNFLADLMRLHHDADCALINGGTFAADQVYPSGPLKLQDIVDCFTYEDPIVMLKVDGQAIQDALENGVSKYPEKDSRFPHVSNITFSFDPDATAGQRVHDVQLGGKPLNVEQEYTIATRSYLAAGKGGYESLRGRADGGNAEEIIDDENGILVSNLLRLFFSNIEIAEVFQHITDKHHNHWNNVLDSLQVLHAYGSKDDRRQALAKRAFIKWRRLAGHEPDLEMQMREGTGELFQGCGKGIVPMVEGRVKVARKADATTQKAEENGGEGRGKFKTMMDKTKSVVVDGLLKHGKK